MRFPAFASPLLVDCIAQLLLGVSGCSNDEVPRVERVAIAASAFTVGNGKLEPAESCDDGNEISGDGCSSTGEAEIDYYCWVPGNACSLKTACGNGTLDGGETCDNGATADNSCSASCDFTNCGNGVRNSGIYPDWSQEICDDSNRYDGDGCNRLCEVEPGWACSGTPSRCAPSGVVFYNTGVANNFRALAPDASDPHWRYTYDNTSAVVHYRDATDWPRSLQGAQYLANATGTAQGNGRGCVYQDFQIPSTYVAANFTLIIAAFNDNNAEADSGQYFANVNGTPAVSGTGLLTLDPPADGQDWQKNILYALTSSNPWVIGLNRVELCNDDLLSGPTGFRYSFADASDGRCGDGSVSTREQCDDANTIVGDGCSISCDIESGFGCVGNPSNCALSCGNGVVNPGEQCDDANAIAGDGCSAACRIESGYNCTTAGSLCLPICGDGRWVAGEQCDDSNTTAADGCSPSCQLMPGWECSGSPGGTSTCSLLCGNSQLDSGELCDDGGRVVGDGCSVGCTVELGWACPAVGGACAETCGNANANAGEQCDDGNTTSGDGCNAECSIESGWVCPTAGACNELPNCGNGALNTGETCDDSNIVAADGCNASCQVESGWQCSGAPSVCGTVCGDSRVTGTETCDDGNLVAGDGCGNACRTETTYACVPASGLGPSRCAKTCGNGGFNAGEQCDDSNTTNGDGCTGSCRFETGWECLGPLGPCREICGNGIRTPSEECDDGNLLATDTCDLLCRLTGTGNGAPRITTLSFGIAEGSVGAVAVLATDPNAADVLTFSLDGGDDASIFTLNVSSGQLTFKYPPDFENPLDVNRDNEYALSVSVSDGQGGADSQTIYLRVTNQSNTPTGGECSGAEDCTSRVCDGSAHTCAAPTCSDAVRNARETAVDCGGGDCPACSNSKSCVFAADCLSDLCDATEHRCLAPTCGDGIKNGSETDVDCGGSTCSACVDARICLDSTDCRSGVCDEATGHCLAPTCTDQVKNAAESDVDCGGTLCSACETAKLCANSADCVSHLCDSNVCIASIQGGSGGGSGQAGAAGAAGAPFGGGSNAGSAGGGPLVSSGGNGGLAGANPTSSADSPAGGTNTIGGSPQGGTKAIGGGYQGGSVATGGNVTSTTLNFAGTVGFGGNAATGGSERSTVGGAEQSLQGGGCNCAFGQGHKNPPALLTFLLALGAWLRRRHPHEED